MNGKVLITGGLGNLGSWLTKEFCNSGYDVYVLTREEKYQINGINYTVIEADITDIDSLRKKLSMNFDYCIHTASYNEYFLVNYHIKAMNVNVLGTRNLLEVLACKNLKKFIYFSTFHVYGAEEGFIDESSELNPKNDYALTHLFAEYYVKQLCESTYLNYSIFRLTNSYGCPSTKESDKWYLVLNDLVKSAYNHEKITLLSNGKASRDFIWMGDVAKITVKSLELDESEIYNLSSMQNYKILQLAYMVQDIYMNRYNKRIKIEVNKNDTNIYNNIIVNNQKLQKLLNFEIHNKFLLEIDKLFFLLERSDDE